MPSLHVCPLSKIDLMVQRTGARSLITLLSERTEVARPAPITGERHLHLVLSDIVDPLDGHILPAEEHVRDLVGFVRRWDRREPMLIHCFAGVSRSTAAAFITVCALEPEQPEREVALRLRKASQTASPNLRLVALADDYLGRKGRMVDAIAAIGSGVACLEGVEFELPMR